MSYTNSDLQKIEGDISNIQKKIEEIEHRERDLKTRLLKPESDVKHSKEKIREEESQLQRAERNVHEINESQAQVAREKSELTSRLAVKNAEQVRAREEIRRTEERNEERK